MNKSLTLNKSNFPLLQAHSKKSLLTLATIASIGIGSNAHAGEIVTCTDGSCTDPMPTMKFKRKNRNTFTASLNTNADATNSLNDNIVTLNYAGTDQPFIRYVYGAFSDAENADINGNTVKIEKGKVNYSVIGGGSRSGIAKNNSAINRDTVGDNLYGGFSTNGHTQNNSVISSGDVDGTVFGGFSTGGFGVKSGNATENKVTIEGGSITSAVHGGRSPYGNATDNSVTISGGNIGYSVYGGTTDKGNATGNSVIISGGHIGTAVYGGAGGHDADVAGNSITIKNNPTFGDNAKLYGGMKAKGGDTFINNTLNLHSKDVTVSDVKNFQNYNFYLDNEVLDGSTMLKLTSTDATDLSTSKYGVGVKTGTTSLPQGYTVTLIESATALTLSSPNPANEFTNMTDIISGYEFRLSVKDGNKLVAELPYTVTIENSDPSKGIVTKTDEQVYRDETITFDATPNPGYVASTSSKCGTTGSWSDNTYTSSEITNECTITVNWEEINYTIFSDSFE